MCLLAQTVDPTITSFMPLVKDFGTWIIWLAVAIYLFKRSEARDEVDKKDRQLLMDKEKAERDSADANRQENYERFIKLQATTMEENKALLLRVVTAMEDSNRVNQSLTAKLGKCKFQMDPDPKS